MNRFYTGIVMLIGLVASTTAAASGAFTGRVGVTGGTYDYEDKFTDVDGFFGAPGTVYSSDESSGQYGVLGGLGLTAGPFFGDLGFEFTTYSQKYDLDGDGVEDNYFRTDGLLTLGFFLGKNFTVFGGYRHATFGDAFFADDYGNTEDGPFLGGGFSFRPGKKVSLGVSAAYNALTLKYDGGAVSDVDLDGISLKFNLGFVGTPHAIFLRWQRFDGDQSENDPAFFRYQYEYSEDYVNLGYQATFGFASW
jgi:hypothetical protein